MSVTAPPAPPAVPSRLPTAARRRPVPVLLLVVLLLGALLGGCARVRTALAVQPDDSVTGEIVLATPQRAPDDKGPTVTVPPKLLSRVEVTAYRQEGYAGSVLTFSGLSFDDVGSLVGAAGPAGDKVRFTLRRVGGRVLVSGSVDLTSVSVDKADFQLKISFPGQVVDTNGQVDDSTVSWTFDAGKVGDIAAVVAYADPDAPSVLNWSIGLSGIVAMVALAVVLLARRVRNPPVGPLIR